MAKTLESSINLKLISAYWCFEAIENLKAKDRFFWAYDKITELTYDANDYAIVILITLAMTAPSERAGSGFAAGPLENYVNAVVGNNLADYAAFIMDNTYLKSFLPGVWGEIERLEPLAKQGGYKNLIVGMPSPNSGLTNFSAKTLMGFWCHTCVSPTVTEYQQYYDAVLKQLFNKNLRDKAIGDLLLTAPDERAATYLNENVLVLRK